LQYRGWNRKLQPLISNKVVKPHIVSKPFYINVTNILNVKFPILAKRFYQYIRRDHPEIGTLVIFFTHEILEWISVATDHGHEVMREGTFQAGYLKTHPLQTALDGLPHFLNERMRLRPQDYSMPIRLRHTPATGCGLTRISPGDVPFIPV